MKKYIAMILAMVMALSLLAGCAKGGEDNTEPTGVAGAASALELMETVWATYMDDQKFPVIGGSMAAPVDGAPGNYDLADENITFSLMIPAEQLANVTEAASMIHMMNANTFTAAAFKLAEGVNAADFAAAMRDSIVNNQWICGFPEQLVINDLVGRYVIVAFGAMDLMEAFNTNLHTAYPDAADVVNEALM